MKPYKNNIFAPVVFSVSLALIFIICVFFIVARGIDFNAPILSERNPDGSIDTWYLFDRAQSGGDYE